MASTGNEAFIADDLKNLINDAMKLAKEKLVSIKSKKMDEVNIGDMFEMQWLMNNMSQLSEMTSQVVSACNTACQSMASKLGGR